MIWLVSKSRLCGQIDSQQHCMLDCTHLAYQVIRTAARTDQYLISKDLLLKARAESTKHFIRHLIKASWSSNDNTSRIWLGLWNEHTLKSLLTQSLEARMTLQTRQAYISIARQLTAPLLSAYYQMRTITHPRQSQPAEQTRRPPCTQQPVIFSNIHIYKCHHPLLLHYSTTLTQLLISPLSP